MTETLFNSLRFCFDQFSADEDLRLKDLVKRHGGKVDYIVTQLTTFVVCPDLNTASAYSTKMVSADNYGVPVISPDYINRCIEFRRIIPLDDILYGEYSKGVQKKKEVDVSELVSEEVVELDSDQTLNVTWRTARVFISSTFLDMHGERDYLTRHVFPELQERCKSLKVHLHPVDLRWGVTGEDTENALELCLTEVDSCRPFFIGILGNRYGWVPDEYKVPNEPQFDWVKSIPSGKSVTHLEILHGALRDPDNFKGMIYFRDSSFLQNVPPEYRDNFVESDPSKNLSLDELKSEIRSKCNKNIKENYPCQWEGIVDDKPMVGHLEEFGNHVLESLWDQIQEEFPLSHFNKNPMDISRAYHTNFIENHSRLFIGRKDIIQKMNDYINNDRTCPLVIVGEPGSGKTSLVSFFTKQLMKDTENRAGNFVIPHFIGAEPGSTTVRNTLVRLIKEFGHELQLPFEEIPNEYKEIQILFLSMIEQIGNLENIKVVIVLDALNQLDSSDSAERLEWLPHNFPSNIKVVVSTLEGPVYNSLSDRETAEIRVGKLSTEEQVQIVEKYLWDYRKKLDDDQTNALIQKTDAFKPLYLIVACEELRVFGVFEKVSEFIENMPDTVPHLFETVIRRLENDHGYDLVRLALSLITCSRGGLLEIEMISLLGDSDEPLPQHIWSSLYRSLINYLRPPGEDGEGVLDFFHQQFPKAVKRAYLHDEEYVRFVNEKMGKYFWKKADPTRNGLWDVSYPRSINYAPTYLIKSKQWEILAHSICNLKFIELKCKQKLTYDLVNDYILLLEFESEIKPEFKERFKQYQRFVLGRAHILAESPHLTFTMAASLPDDTYPYMDSVYLYTNKLEERPYLKWLNKPQFSDPCIMTLSGHDMAVRATDCQNGKILAGSDDGTLKIYNSQTGTEMITLKGHSNSVMCCRFYNNGRKVISGSYDRTIKVFNADTGACEDTIQGHRNVIVGVDISSEGKIASISKDLSLAVWSNYGRAYSQVFSVPTSEIPTAVRFNHRGGAIAVGYESGRIALYDSISGSETLSAQYHTAQINSIRFSSDDRYILTSSEDRLVVLAEASTMSIKFQHSAHKDGSTCAIFDSTDKKIISGSHDNMICVHDIEFETKVATLIGHTGTVFSLCITEDDKFIISSSFDRTVKVWEVTESENAVGHEARILGIRFSPDGRFVATGSRDKTIKIWDTESYEEINHLKGHFNNVFCVAWSPDSQNLCSGGRDFTVRIWKELHKEGCIRSRETTLSVHTFPVRGIDWSPDGRFIVSVSEDRSICIFDCDGNLVQRMMEAHKTAITACRFSHSGRKFVTGSEDGTIFLWDTLKTQSSYGSPFKKVATLKSHTNLIQSLCFSKNDKYLFSGADDKTAILWNAKNSQVVTVLKGHSHPVRGVAISPDFKYLITASTDSYAIVWDATTFEKLVSFASMSRLCTADATNKDGNLLLGLGDGSGVLYLLDEVGVKTK
eukprot:TRINITY_DN5286_c0_g1_i1.p1 TRINITY_DN5286_c0_g1~~TRINITY_DN5286_c0_g1_i1.p1  ORF type:complete len:1465 (-),score=299.18 TRINITY_DN5286_c0_g1_i1:13-4407(-)